MNEIAYTNISGAGENPDSAKGAIYLYYRAMLDIYNTEFKDLGACGVYGILLNSQSENPNFISSNLSFINTPCNVLFEQG